MSEPSLSNSATDSDQSVVAAQQSQSLTPENVQGSAMLDAHIAAGGNQPEGEPMDAPIATNFSGATRSGDAKTADVSGEMGAFSTGSSAPEKGLVNFHNNPDIPATSGDSPQGALPDTDQTSLPTDAAVNLPD